MAITQSADSREFLRNIVADTVGELNQTVLTWEFPVLNVYLLVSAFRRSQSWPHPLFSEPVSRPSAEEINTTKASIHQ